MCEKDFCQCVIVSFHSLPSCEIPFFLFASSPPAVFSGQTQSLAPEIPWMSVQTSTSLHKQTHLIHMSVWPQHVSLQLIYFSSRSLCQCEMKGTRYIQIDYFLPRRVWAFFFWCHAMIDCFGWPFVWGKKKSECVYTVHIGVKLLGQDKCVTNHFWTCSSCSAEIRIRTHKQASTHLIVFTCPWFFCGWNLWTSIWSGGQCRLIFGWKSHVSRHLKPRTCSILLKCTPWLSDSGTCPTSPSPSVCACACACVKQGSRYTRTGTQQAWGGWGFEGEEGGHCWVKSEIHVFFLMLREGRINLEWKYSERLHLRFLCL